MGFVFGVYLYVCVCWFHVHYDEAFSALRIQAYKGFARLRITKEGDLEIWALGADRVPAAWREDPRWRGPRGAGGGSGGGGGAAAAPPPAPAHAAAVPSRWLPAGEAAALRRAAARRLRGGKGAAAGAAGGAGAPASAAALAEAADAAAAGVVDPALGFRVVDYVFVPRRRNAAAA